MKSDTQLLDWQKSEDKVETFTSDSSKGRIFYNQAKWIMYCIHCDEVTRWRPQYFYLPSVPVGTLDLRFRGASEKGDTVEIYCMFYYHDSIPCNANTLTNYFDLLNGIGFDKKSVKKLYFIRDNAMFVSLGKNMRYINELQPEVIEYIQKNRNELNPWFRDEAIRKGILR
jgi:hypothetical protein